MEYQTYINKILTSGDERQYAQMSDFLCDLIEMVGKRETEKIEQKLYEIVEGKVLNEEKATQIIKHMKPIGMKWTLEETEGVRNSYGYENIRPIDFWVVMNSAINDYEDLFKDNIEWYAKFSKDFIDDEDAIDEKVYVYFMKIPKKGE